MRPTRVSSTIASSTSPLVRLSTTEVASRVLGSVAIITFMYSKALVVALVAFMLNPKNLATASRKSRHALRFLPLGL